VGRRTRQAGLFDFERPDREPDPPPVPEEDPLAERREASKLWLSKMKDHVPRRREEQEPEYLTRIGAEWARRFPDLAEENHRAARRMTAPTLRQLRGQRK
jgi:hypothetical protein